MIPIFESKESSEQIEKFSSASRDPFTKNAAYTACAEIISPSSKVVISEEEQVKYINSSYSRYDGSGIYYFERTDGKILEIWWSDRDEIGRLATFFRLAGTRQAT